jgi:arylsulfatase A-like enzyme
MTVRDEQLEAWPRQPEAVRRHIADYYAMIAHVDDQVGRVLAELEAAGEAENTILVFASDNGLALGQHGLMGKQNLYEHSVGIPLVFAGPGIPAGARCRSLCYLLDVFPTLCDLASVPIPASVEGLSLVPAMAGPSAPVRDSLYHAYRHVQRAVRDDRHKLIAYNSGGTGAEQLFDLEDDPMEMDDLIDSPAHTAVATQLRERLHAWRQQVDDHGRDLAGAPDPGAAPRFWERHPPPAAC